MPDGSSTMELSVAPIVDVAASPVVHQAEESLFSSPQILDNPHAHVAPNEGAEELLTVPSIDGFIGEHYRDDSLVWSGDRKGMWRKLRAGDRGIWDLAAEQLRMIPKDNQALRERVKAAVGTIYLTALISEGVERGVLDNKIAKGTSLAALIQSSWIPEIPKLELDKIRSRFQTNSPLVQDEGLIEELMFMKQAVKETSPLLNQCLDDLLIWQSKSDQLVILRAAMATIDAISTSNESNQVEHKTHIPTQALQIGTTAVAGILDTLTTGIGLHEGLVEMNPLLHEISTLFSGETGITALEAARIAAVIFEAGLYLLKVRNDKRVMFDETVDDFPEEYPRTSLNALKSFVSKPNTIITGITFLQFADVLSNIFLLGLNNPR